MRFPQRRLHSSAGFPHRTRSHTPRPSTPDTPRPLPPLVVRAKTLLQHPRASSYYVALVYVASDGAEHLDQPADLPGGYHNPASSTLTASNVRYAWSSRGLPGSLDGDFADGAGVGARAPS